MGRLKQYRQRLRYQVQSVRKKTLRSQLAVQLRDELALSTSEAELLPGRLERYVQQRMELRSPEQIVLTAVAGRDGFGRRHRGESRINPVPRRELEGPDL